MRHLAKLGTVLLLTAYTLVAGVAGAESDASAPDTAASSASDDPQSMIEKELAKIPSGAEGEKLMLDMLDERLALTPDQVEQVKPVISETVATLEQARDRFKAGELTPMALMMQIQMATRKSSMQITPLLDEAQKVEYQAMQMEQKEAMKAEMVKRRDAMMGGGM